jgi:site-specific recombinase XerD
MLLDFGRVPTLYELAKILGHSNIKMTERYAKLGREHITKTSTTAK